MAELLTDQAIQERLQGSAWRRDGDTIVRELKFKDFAQAIAFVNRVAEAAESANHHPDITVHGYNNVRLSLSTHSAGGLTDADFELSGQLDRLVENV
jgi:4a-hydroxytetrahydrobiopterin dehydratase